MKPPTEQELRKLALERAELGDINYFTTKTQGGEIFEELSRESYIISAALERWADDMKEDRELQAWHDQVNARLDQIFAASKRSASNKGTK